MKPNITSINDIARALGVSASTVSRALKDHPDISEETRRRVQEFARSVNYRPNALALGLKQQRSYTLGIIIPEIVHHFFSSIISGIEDVAYGKGYRLMICQSNEEFERERINLQALLDHRVDGLLVSMSKNTFQYDHFEDTVAQGIPMVFFDRVCKQIETDRVVTDDFQGAHLITTHLIRNGHRRILHLAAPQHLAIGRKRLQGYTEALSDHNIPVDPLLILQCDTPAQVHAVKEQILRLAPKIDGVFAVNDFSAIAVMQLLQENGYQIPEQISVAGFGDDPIALIARPKLTTVEQKGYAMGREAVQMLINRLEHPDLAGEFQTKIFAATLKLRDSA
ncbi:MAG: LacI family DNA-binding transcriptional regulator [Bacteroides sp.]|jgi:LacI family transcriptional regulator|nr:LacI family DNA-binding transcriptional regulator [Bacteroides sp.]